MYTYQTRCYLGSGQKAKHEIMRSQCGRELKDVNLSEILKLFKKTVLLTRNLFHSKAQFFNVEQKEDETPDDTGGKCEFTRITPEEIITHKFAATMIDKKHETNSSRDHYNYGRYTKPSSRTIPVNTETSNKKNKKPRKISSDSSSNAEQIAYTRPARKRKPIDTDRKQLLNRNCHFCGTKPARKRKPIDTDKKQLLNRNCHFCGRSN